MNSNTVFQTTVVVVLLAHVGALLGLWFGPRTNGVILGLNAIIAVGVLAYGASRLRYIFAANDVPQLALMGFELVVLATAIWAFRLTRPALICSYVAFVLHFIIAVGAVIFAFAFKMTRLF